MRAKLAPSRPGSGKALKVQARYVRKQGKHLEGRRQALISPSSSVIRFSSSRYPAWRRRYSPQISLDSSTPHLSAAGCAFVRPLSCLATNTPMDAPQSSAADDALRARFSQEVRDAISHTVDELEVQRMIYFALCPHLLRNRKAFETVAAAEEAEMVKTLVAYLREHCKEYVAPMESVMRKYLLQIFRAMRPPSPPSPTPSESTSPDGRRQRSISPNRRNFPKRKWDEIAADHEDLWEFLARLATMDATTTSLTCVCGKSISAEQGYNVYTHIIKCPRGKNLFLTPAQACGRAVLSRPSAEQLQALQRFSPKVLAQLQPAITAAIRDAQAELAVSNAPNPAPDQGDEARHLVAPVSEMPLHEQDGNFLSDALSSGLK